MTDAAVKRMQLQRAEFDAANEFSAQLKRLNQTAVVDDDYPEVRHNYEGVLAGLIEAMNANGRFGNGNRYGLHSMQAIEQHRAVLLIVNEVLAELARATLKFPTWPTDPLHAVAVLNEEVGELNKAVLQGVYERNKNPPNAVHDEAVQAAAMALRFIASLDKYDFSQAAQHSQEPQS